MMLWTIVNGNGMKCTSAEYCVMYSGISGIVKSLSVVADHKIIAKHHCGLVMKKRNILLGHCNSIPVAMVV